MDVIAEILNTEKIAEEKLKQAEEESVRLLEECEKEKAKIENDSAKSIENYKQSKQQEADKQILAVQEEIMSKEKEKFDELDNIYNENHEKWEKEMIDRILSV